MTLSLPHFLSVVIFSHPLSLSLTLFLHQFFSTVCVFRVLTISPLANCYWSQSRCYHGDIHLPPPLPPSSAFFPLPSLLLFLTFLLPPSPASSFSSSTVVDNSQEYRRKYWATRSSVRSFARTAHSFAWCGLLASIALSAALTRLLARSLRPLPRSWDSE